MSTNYLLQMKDISKSFPGVRALNRVNFNLRPQSVHALCGENGAGKSTLMKILAGSLKADDGEIRINGEKVLISNPKESLKNGISMIYQELNPIPDMTIAENLFVGRELTKYGLIAKKQMLKEAKKILESCGVYLNPSTKMYRLSVAEIQLIEIVKAVFYESKIVVMDEPTSPLTSRETENLFKVIDRLVKDGRSIIYITHRLEEVMQICDEVTVLRDAELVDSKKIEELDTQKIISLMVGRELSDLFPKMDAAIGDIALEVKNLSKEGKFQDISFKVHKGEILGFAGLVGAGRTEVADAIFGFHNEDSGEIYINGEQVNIKTPRQAIRHKLAYVTEDRKLIGLNLSGSVAENISIVNLAKYCLGGQLLNYGKERRAVDSQIRTLSIKTPSRRQTVSNLSGGNQQKVVLAKWLLSGPDIIILDEPTRGIDVGAKAEIHRLMSALAQQGKAIIMISSEMPEVMGMSDRMIVLHEGKITGEYLRKDFDQEKIMACAAGYTA